MKPRAKPKPPSSDIVKPPKPDNPKGPGRQGGQPGHRGVNRPPFRPNQNNHVEELHPPACPHGHDGTLEPVGEPKIQQVAERREDPLQITEYRRHGYRCSVCGRIVWPELSPDVVKGQLFNPPARQIPVFSPENGVSSRLRTGKPLKFDQGVRKLV